MKKIFIRIIILSFLLNPILINKSFAGGCLPNSYCGIHPINYFPIYLVIVSNIQNSFSFEIIKLIIKNKRNGSIEKFYQIISKNGDSKELERLIKKGVDVNYKNEYGRTPLMRAMDNFNISPQIIETLLKHGAKVNPDNKKHITTLMIAAAHCENLAIIKNIIAESDINAKNNQGQPALYFAMLYNKNPYVIKMLIKHGATKINAEEEKKLLKYYAKNNPKIFENMLNNGADIYTKDIIDRTILHEVISFIKDPEIIEILANKGIDINARTKVGTTAIITAGYKNINPKIMEKLITLGADVNDTDRYGNTALSGAKKYNKNPIITKILIENGAK